MHEGALKLHQERTCAVVFLLGLVDDSVQLFFRMDVHLHVQALNVGANGRQGDAKLGRDFFVAHTHNEMPRYVFLPFREIEGRQGVAYLQKKIRRAIP